MKLIPMTIRPKEGQEAIDYAYCLIFDIQCELTKLKTNIYEDIKKEVETNLYDQIRERMFDDSSFIHKVEDIKEEICRDLEYRSQNVLSNSYVAINDYRKEAEQLKIDTLAAILRIKEEAEVKLRQLKEEYELP